MKLFLGLLIVIAMVTMLPKCGEMKRMKSEDLVKSYPKAVEEYLETKYGKKFKVNPKFFVQSGGPVPFSYSYAPYEFKVSEDGEDGYSFYVNVYPESEKNKKIKDIQDNYYWKSIEKETKEYLRQEMAELLPNEYKFIFIGINLRSTFFDDNFKPGILIEEYFKTAKSKVRLRLYVITPPENLSDGKITKDNLYPILFDFYLKNYSNIEIDFYYNQTETYDDYKSIDVKEFERSIYYTSLKEYDKLWSLLGAENKIEIKIK